LSLNENVPPVFEKCAIVIDGALPAGLAMNAAAVLALSLGDAYGRAILGPDIKDADGQVHTGITAAPIPILRAESENLSGIAAKAYADPELFLVDFTAVAQASRDYADYTEVTGRTGAAEHTYVGVALVGSKRAVNKVTGSLPLYR
jgi:hypothetical protein